MNNSLNVRHEIKVNLKADENKVKGAAPSIASPNKLRIDLKDR